MRGYLGNEGSVRERSQSEKRDPRVLRTLRWCTQASQRPAAVLDCCRMRTPIKHSGAGQEGRPYLMNRISEYFGSGQRSSATMPSSRSPSSRTFPIAVIWLSRA